MSTTLAEIDEALGHASRVDRRLRGAAWARFVDMLLDARLQEGRGAPRVRPEVQVRVGRVRRS